MINPFTICLEQLLLVWTYEQKLIYYKDPTEIIANNSLTYNQREWLYDYMEAIEGVLNGQGSRVNNNMLNLPINRKRAKR